MKKYYFFLPLLLMVLTACSQQSTGQATLSKINKQNAALSVVKVENIKSYRFKKDAVFNYTLFKQGKSKIFVNDNTQSFVWLNDKNELYFYDKDIDTLFFENNTKNNAKLFFEDFWVNHLFVLNPKKYWNYNSARNFKDVDTLPYTITFNMKSFNENWMGDKHKMFLKTKGTYIIDTALYLIQSFVKETDTAQIVGEGVYKEVYCLQHNLSNQSEQKTHQFIDSIIHTKTTYDFSKVYDISTRILNSEEQSGRPKNPQDTLAYNGYIRTLAGDSLMLSDLESEYILVDFWFMRCPGCVQGIPYMNEIKKKYPREKLSVIGVNTLDKQVLAIKDFIQKMGVDYPIYLADRSFAEHYNIKYFPTYVLIDNRNKNLSVVGTYKEDELKAVLENL